VKTRADAWVLAPEPARVAQPVLKAALGVLLLATVALVATPAVATPSIHSASLPQPRKAVVPTPGTVKHLRVVRESDGLVKAAWSKPTGDFSAVTGYLVSYTGSSGVQIVRSQKASVTYAAHVPNGQPITISVRAINGLGVSHPGPAREVSGIASGKPDAPTWLAVTGVNVAGGAKKSISLSWLPVSPNGRGQTRYQVQVDGVAMQCAAAEWIADTSCVLRAANNGVTHRYLVVAANRAGIKPTAIEGKVGAHRSRSSQRSVTAAGTPVGLSSLALVATGADGRASLSFDVGASHGAKNVVTCTGGGATCTTWNLAPKGDNVTTTLTGLTNGATTTVSLLNCNGAVENSDLDIHPCASAATASVVTFGPITTPTITATPSGNSVLVQATVNPNGRDVTATISSSAGGSHVCNLSGAGPMACAWTQTALNYSTSYTYTVTVADASGAGRASKAASVATRTGADPNVPTVTVSHGPSHLATGCTIAACARVRTTTAHFASTVTCHITAAYPDTAGFISWTQGADATKDGPDYFGYPGHTVTVQCTDANGNVSTGTSPPW